MIAPLATPLVRSLALPLFRQGGGGDFPSLDLAFALDRSFTADPAAAGNALITSRRGPAAKFSRGTGATQVNAAGLIEYAPENLLTRSEEFNDAYWTPVRTSVGATQYVSPIGSITADKIIADSTPSANHRIDRASLALVTRTTYTVSVFAKAAEYTGFGIGLDTGAPFTGVQFDLTGSGSITLQNAGFVGSITSVGDGWFRCTATITSDPSITSYRLYLFVGQNGTTFTFTGDGTSGIFLWGAQLERASTARTYYPTTTAAFYGPRFDYDPATGASKGLLIEESRTNLVERSEAFNDAYWTKAGGIVTAPVVTADQVNSPSGVQSADRIVFPAVAGTNAFSLVFREFTQAAGVSTTQSIYLRGLIGGEKIWIMWTPNGTTYVRKECVLTTSWQRFDVTYTSTSGLNYFQFGVDLRDASQSAQLTQTIFAWGAQLEAGAFPTSYIPTTSGTAARSADVCSIIGTDFSSFYNQSEGTILARADKTMSSSAVGSYLSFFAGATEVGPLITRTSSQLLARIRSAAGLDIANADFTETPNGLKSVAVAWRSNSITSDRAVVTNGVLVTLTNLQAVDAASNQSSLNIGSRATGVSIFNGHIARIQYFRKRLSNAKLQSLTYPDDDADAYIAKVELMLGGSIYSALPNATSDAKRIITDFIKAEKTAGMWSMHRWLNLTIFNNSAASSIDMVARNVGQFALSGVTHAAGYVQGNGTSGYFDTLINWNTFATVDNATIGTINLTGNGSPNTTSIGVGATGGTSISCGSQNSGIIPSCNWAGAGIVRGAIGTSGIQMASRSGGVTRMIRRSASGITEDTNSGALTGSVVNAPITMMARRTAAGASFSQYTNAQIGGGIISLGMTSTQLADYSLRLKNLYESLTGLNLPA